MSVPRANPLWWRVGWVFLFIGAVFAAGNAVLFITVPEYGSPEIKDRFVATALAGWAHTMGGAVAVMIGPFQFLGALRRAWPRVHAWMGRTYLVAVLCGALAGLFFAPTSPAGPVATAGFTVLAIFWLYTGTQAYLAIRRRDIASHRRWMVRNYSLTFAAATLRVQLPLLIIAGVGFPAVLAIVSWISWIPNWLIVEAWLRRRPRPSP